MSAVWVEGLPGVQLTANQENQPPFRINANLSNILEKWCFFFVELKKTTLHFKNKKKLGHPNEPIFLGSSFVIPLYFWWQGKGTNLIFPLRCAHLPCPKHAETTAVLPPQKRMGSFQTSVKSGWRGPAPGLERSHAGETHQQQDYQDARFLVFVFFIQIPSQSLT